MAEAIKPHAVFIAYPHQSHIKATMNLAKLLHHRGYFITFVNTDFNHKRLLRSKGPSFLECLPDFRFETIPDGLSPSDSDSSQDASALCESITHNFLAPFRNLLVKLNENPSTENPPVTCIVADGLMFFTFAAAEEFGIPVAAIFTLAACGVMGYYKFCSLFENGLAPLKDVRYLKNGYLENTSIQWIAEKSIRLKDLPSRLRTADPNDVLFHFLMESAQDASKASVVIIHTFDALEKEILEFLSSKYPLVHAIGPLSLLLNKIPKENPLNSLDCNMWKEEAECLQWLNSQKHSSVLYVNFGSVVAPTPEQLGEFCWGIVNSKHPFLWIIRPDLVDGKSSALPDEILAETKDKGFLAGWCPQEEVLNHPSVGGFLTHSGWNSTIESLSSGVPMICWPVNADQQINCRYACSEWEVGLEIDQEVKRDEVERVVRELMDGEQGKTLRNNAKYWKKVAEEATSEYGSSSLSMDQLVKILSASRN